ncbi:hypothetical protein Dsin_021668 [Dipteronia sinensis]|uniref:Uncharacterized protein n=1 Tax=Dipteronia sinensis TaxID=43782 RepID=A0AAD9ZZZ2_9ROSI|nr:hypothetical protein Dsin_021668 [Dipteronia sinensis]
MIIGWFCAGSFVLHVLLSWIFVSKLNLGIPGAMGAMIISSWFVVIGEFVYIFGGWCPDTWTGFTWAAFADLFPALKLSISSGVMLCLKLWYNAVLILLAGHTSNATLQFLPSPFALILQIGNFRYALVFARPLVFNQYFQGAFGTGTGKNNVGLDWTVVLYCVWNACDRTVDCTVMHLGWQLVPVAKVLWHVLIWSSYYVIGVPIGAILGYVAHLQVKGI